MSRQNVVTEYLPRITHTFTIDRAIMLMNGQEVSDDHSKENPVGQYVMQQVRLRHALCPETVRKYARAFNPNNPESDYETTPERLITVAGKVPKTDERIIDAIWMEDILRAVTQVDPNWDEQWIYTEETEEIMNLSSGQDPRVPDRLPMKVREARIVENFRKLGIDASFSGKYDHPETPCARDGHCCVDFKPAELAQSPEQCIPNRRHFFAAANAFGRFESNTAPSVSVSETCLRCGAQRSTSGPVPGGSPTATFENFRAYLPPGVTIGPYVLVTGAPGAQMLNTDPPGAFSALVNGAFPDRAVMTLDERDVSHLTCEKCGLWVGDPSDPDIAHVSARHQPSGCPAEPTA